MAEETSSVVLFVSYVVTSRSGNTHYENGYVVRPNEPQTINDIRNIETELSIGMIYNHVSVINWKVLNLQGKVI